VKAAPLIFGTGFAIIGSRFALAAGGVLELDLIDYGFAAFILFVMAHGAYTVDVSTEDDD